MGANAILTPCTLWSVLVVLHMRYTGRRLGARVALLTPAASLAEAEALCRGVETVQTAALGAAHRDTLRRWRRGGLLSLPPPHSRIVRGAVWRAV